MLVEYLLNTEVIKTIIMMSDFATDRETRLECLHMLMNQMEMRVIKNNILLLINLEYLLNKEKLGK